MERKPEPELMEDDVQAGGYAEADFEDAHSNFITLFKITFGCKNVNGHVLDISCGPGDISIRFAREYNDCTIHGIDGSMVMLHYGNLALSKAVEVKDRIRLMQGVLPHVRISPSKYETIICNSVLHHLKDTMVLWNTIKSYATNEARIFIMDLKDPQPKVMLNH